jgi:hypothetical protein
LRGKTFKAKYKERSGIQNQKQTEVLEWPINRVIDIHPMMMMGVGTVFLRSLYWLRRFQLLYMEYLFVSNNNGFSMNTNILPYLCLPFFFLWE